MPPGRMELLARRLEIEGGGDWLTHSFPLGGLGPHAAAPVFPKGLCF